MLEGKNVNLKVLEKEGVDYLFECINDIDIWGEYVAVDEQISKSELIKGFDNPSNWEISCEIKRFIIQKKDGTRIGIIWHLVNQPSRIMEIGYVIAPSERGRGNGTEAVQLMVDYLFLSRNILRIQGTTNVRNRASQRVLEKAGFRIEGTCRKSSFVRGIWTDSHLYSILREEWKEPKILTKTA